MAMLHLNSLQEQLRPVARLVFPSDPVQCVNLSNTNRYTRLYLRRIIQLAKNDSFRLKITNQQLARLFRIPLKKFVQWFCHDVRLPKVFRRVRYFLREIILMNILEDLGELDILRNRNIANRPIDPPSRNTMAHWQQRIEAIREEHRNQGPVIPTLSEAEELIEWIQGGYSSSCSFESDDDSESISCGEIPDEKRFVTEINCGSTEPLSLNGPAVILNDYQLAELCKDSLIESDKLDNSCSDNDESLSGVYHLLNQKLCFQVDYSK